MAPGSLAGSYRYLAGPTPTATLPNQIFRDGWRGQGKERPSLGTDGPLV